MHQAVTGNGSITARVTALASEAPAPPGTTMGRVAVPWAKAGIILKASLGQGSAYAAIMVTGGHGVRMQDDYTGDIAGPAMSAGWLRLVRTGDTFTGYASATGRSWARVGAVSLPGWAPSVPAGLFVTSPQVTQTALGVAQVSGSASESTAAFDHVALSWPSAAWTGTDLGGGDGPLAGPPDGYARRGGGFTVTGPGAGREGDRAGRPGPDGVRVALAPRTVRTRRAGAVRSMRLATPGVTDTGIPPRCAASCTW